MDSFVVQMFYVDFLVNTATIRLARNCHPNERVARQRVVSVLARFLLTDSIVVAMTSSQWEVLKCRLLLKSTMANIPSPNKLVWLVWLGECSRRLHVYLIMSADNRLTRVNRCNLQMKGGHGSQVRDQRNLPSIYVYPVFFTLFVWFLRKFAQAGCSIFTYSRHGIQQNRCYE